jgi:DNA-binding transcriptional ArsR family regulator
MAESVQLDHLFHALADSTRRRIVDHLSRGPASVMALAEPHSMALPSLMKHLRVLEAGGIVMSKKAGRVRTYQIDPRALSHVEKWVAARRKAWNSSFDRLERYLAENP